MTITDEQAHKLKKFIRQLDQYQGRHTELVSVYIPAGYEISKIVNHLFQEQGTATNIKSKATRDNVIGSLEKMLQHLKLYKQTPPHGLAVFAGDTSEREGQPDIKAFSIEPPVPLNLRLYRCDKTFVLDPLKDMLDIKEVYAMVVMDRRDSIIALLKGKTIIPLVKSHSDVPGKFKAGGQSAQRFARNRELAAKDFYKRIAEYMKQQLLGNKELKGILVGGPGPTKYEFVEGGYITTELKNKIIAIKDLSYTEEFGLQELLEKCQDVLANEEVSKEKKIMNDFFLLLSTRMGMVAYGMAEVRAKLDMGIVATLLLSEALDEGIIDELTEKAKLHGSEVRIISVETREGVQLKELGKVAAILRYEG